VKIPNKVSHFDLKFKFLRSILAEMRAKPIKILERTHEIRSFAIIRDLLAHLQASQINFEISTWT